MRCVSRPDPKSLAIWTSLNESQFSAGAKIPGGINQFECEASFGQDQPFWRNFGQNRNSQQYFPETLGVFRSEPKRLAICPSLNARCCAVRAKIPGDISQFGCEVFVGQDRNSWRYVPICMRCVLRLEPERLAIFSSVNEGCVSVRTETPGSIYQFEYEALLCQNQSSSQFLPV